MLTTYNKEQWVEDTEVEQKSRLIDHTTSEAEVRRLYPYRAMVRGRCMAYQLKEGTIIPYARTKHTINHFPIEACTYGMGKEKVKLLCLNSQEVQLIEA